MNFYFRQTKFNENYKKEGEDSPKSLKSSYGLQPSPNIKNFALFSDIIISHFLLSLTTIPLIFCF